MKGTNPSQIHPSRATPTPSIPLKKEKKKKSILCPPSISNSKHIRYALEYKIGLSNPFHLLGPLFDCHLQAFSGGTKRVSSPLRPVPPASCFFFFVFFFPAPSPFLTYTPLASFPPRLLPPIPSFPFLYRILSLVSSVHGSKSTNGQHFHSLLWFSFFCSYLPLFSPFP